MTVPLPSPGDVDWIDWAQYIHDAVAASGGGVDAADVGFDVVLLMGQSNMQGMGTTSALPRMYPTDPRVWAWEAGGAYANRPAQAPGSGLFHQGGQGTGISPGHTFALEYVGTTPANRRVLLVPAAYSGTSFSTAGGQSGNVWDSDGTGNLYTGAIALARAALSSHANNRLAAVLWHQGESATNLTGPQYTAKLDALIAKTRADLSAPNVPFIVGGLVPEWVGTDPSRTAIEAVLAGLPDRVARTAYARGPRNSYDGPDAAMIHFGNVGSALHGRGYFDAFPYAQGNTTPGTSPKVPAPPAVTGLAPGAFSDVAVPLSWLPSPGAYNYRVEHRAGTSGAWTEDFVSQATSFTVSGLAAATAYQFRVTALGPGGDSAPAQVSVTTAAGGDPPPVSGFTDDFSGGTAGASLSTLGWTVPNAAAGKDVIRGSGDATPSGDTSGWYIAVRDLGSADGTVAADVAGTANWVAGLILRYQDASNYLVAVGNGIVSVVGGTETTLVTPSAVTYPTRLSATMSGSTITLFAGGTQVATTTTTLFQSSKVHGIVLRGLGSPVIDNFAYTPPA